MKLEIDSSSKDMKKFYNNMYSDYSIDSLTLGYKLAVIRIMKRLNISRESTGNLLEIGCGTGNTSRVISLHSKLKCYGFDISEEIIRKANALNTPNCIFEVSDGETFPFRHLSFDYVIINHVLEHVPNPEAFVLQISSLIKPDGLLFCGSPNNKKLLSPWLRNIREKTDIPHGHIQPGFSKSEITQMLTKNSLRIQKFGYNTNFFRIVIGNLLKVILNWHYKFFKLLTGKRGLNSQFRSYVLLREKYINGFLDRVDKRVFSNSESWMDFWLVAVK